MRELSQSFLIAFVIISTLMCLLLRSVKLGLLSMLPNALPAVFVLGMMTLRGTPLDLTHVLLASVVLGVAVDDTVHLFHGYIVRRRAGYASEAAIRDTFGAVGRAAILSTVVLSLGMLLYTGSSMSTVRSFGLLAGLAVIVALVADLVVLPALLRVLARNEAGPERTAPAEVAHAR